VWLLQPTLSYGSGRVKALEFVQLLQFTFWINTAIDHFVDIL
jgi:hypothetical protein